jgi:hypothetical protein
MKKMLKTLGGVAGMTGGKKGRREAMRMMRALGR